MLKDTSTMDRLTQLQMVLDGLSTQMFTSIGVLQRDAPSRALNLPSSTTGNDEFDKTIQTMAKQMVHTTQLVDSLLDSLPTTDEEELQLERITKLRKEDEAASEELQRELQRAEALLATSRSAFLALSRDRLAVLTPTGPADPTLLAAVQAAVTAASAAGNNHQHQHHQDSAANASSSFLSAPNT